LEFADGGVEEYAVLGRADFEHFRWRDAKFEGSALAAEGIDMAFRGKAVTGVSIERVVFFADIEDRSRV
jgi:hypothetical protein